MKRLPLKYRLNVIGAALLVFLCVRTYLPQLAAGMGLDKHFTVWLFVCILSLALSCLLPIMLIEKMCEFHPLLLKKKKITVAEPAMVMHCMFVFIGLAVVNSVILSALQKAGIMFPVQELHPVDNPFTLIVYFVFTAVVPAIFEELLVRGYILNMLLPNGKRFAVILSALIFMVMHTQVQSFLPVLGAGILLACIYIYTNNIFVSMALHFVNNAYSFIMMYMRQSVNAVSSVAFTAFLISVIISCGIAAEIYMRKADIHILSVLADGTEKNASLSAIFRSPVLIVSVIMCLAAVASQLIVDLGIM